MTFDDVRRIRVTVAACCSAILLSACGGSGDSPQPGVLQPGVLQLAASTASIDENGGVVTLTITRTGGSDGTVAVTVATTDGSATAGQDYTSLGTSVSFGPGETAAKTIDVQLRDDTVAEFPETLTLGLSKPTGGATLGAERMATITVRDDDPITLNLNGEMKKLLFSWPAVQGATSYRLLQNAEGPTRFTQIGPEHAASEMGTALAVDVFGFDWAHALYRLEACRALDCMVSNAISALPAMQQTIGYFKASNTAQGDSFGTAVALSGDGLTLAVGAPHEDGTSTDVNGDPSLRGAVTDNPGAAYVFARTSLGAPWLPQAYLKASNTGKGDQFGISIALSRDGNTLAVGAIGEASAAELNQGDDTAPFAGAVYVFVRDGNSQWTQQAYVKASNPDSVDQFGSAVALSADGSTLAVGAPGEDSDGGDQFRDNVTNSGAVYVYRRTNAQWTQEFFGKGFFAVNSVDEFGGAVALSGDGNVLAVGAIGDDTAGTGVDNLDHIRVGADFNAGAVYTFRHTADVDPWTPESYIKASNTGADDRFGHALALDDKGTTLAVSAIFESSTATGVAGDEANDDALQSGAVYVFARSDVSSAWMQQAYVKASNTGPRDHFGSSLALSADGSSLAVSAIQEDSAAVGINGDEQDDSSADRGAVYVFRRDANANWARQAYVKPSNDTALINFGDTVSLSADGITLAVGAHDEGSNAKDIGGDQTDQSMPGAGAVYLY